MPDAVSTDDRLLSVEVVEYTTEVELNLPGIQGPIGGPGGAETAVYTFSEATADDAPSSGHVHFNNSSYLAVTRILISALDAFGADLSAWLESLAIPTGSVKGYLRLASIASSSTDWVLFAVSDIESAADHYRVEVAYVAGSGSMTNAIASTVVSFSRAGDIGPQGAQGPIGPQGTAAVWTQLTQSQYDAIGSPEPNVLYLIVG